MIAIFKCFLLVAAGICPLAMWAQVYINHVLLGHQDIVEFFEESDYEIESH